MVRCADAPNALRARHAAHGAAHPRGCPDADRLPCPECRGQLQSPPYATEPERSHSPSSAVQPHSPHVAVGSLSGSSQFSSRSPTGPRQGCRTLVIGTRLCRLRLSTFPVLQPLTRSASRPGNAADADAPTASASQWNHHSSSPSCSTVRPPSRNQSRTSSARASASSGRVERLTNCSR